MENIILLTIILTGLSISIAQIKELIRMLDILGRVLNKDFDKGAYIQCMCNECQQDFDAKNLPHQSLDDMHKERIAYDIKRCRQQTAYTFFYIAITAQALYLYLQQFHLL